MDDRVDLVRCWFEFDLTGHAPPPPPPGTISVDGGDAAYRLLGRGVGVTGRDADDCLALIREALGGDELPPVISIETDVDVSERGGLAHEAGVPVWRGIRFPRLNMGGPTA